MFTYGSRSRSVGCRQVDDAAFATILPQRPKHGNIWSLNGTNRNVRAGWSGHDRKTAFQTQAWRGMPRYSGVLRSELHTSV